MQSSGGRVLLGVATDLAEEIVAELSAIRACTKCTYAGSVRRMADTVGDIDVLAASEDPGPVLQAVRSLSYVQAASGSGGTKTSIRTTTGLRVDVRVIPPNAWSAALPYSTAST